MAIATRPRKRLLLSAFTRRGARQLPARHLRDHRALRRRLVAAAERAIAGDSRQLGFDIADMLFAASDPATSNLEGAARLHDDEQGRVLAADQPAVHRVRQGDQGARSAARLHQARRSPRRTARAARSACSRRARGPNGEQLSTAELEIELLHFFFAAHGGLTAALAWLLVVLGEHPDLAAKLRAEADAMLGDGPPTLAQIAHARARARGLARGAARLSDRADDVLRRREDATSSSMATRSAPAGRASARSGRRCRTARRSPIRRRSAAIASATTPRRRAARQRVRARRAVARPRVIAARARR